MALAALGSAFAFIVHQLRTVTLLQPQAQGLSLKANITKKKLMAPLDHDRILQVLANLLSNALKFTPEGGRISIQVEPVGRDVRFSVTDTGAGIPSDFRGPRPHRNESLPFQGAYSVRMMASSGSLPRSCRTASSTGASSAASTVTFTR